MDTVECWVRHGARSHDYAGKGDLLILPHDTATIDVHAVGTAAVLIKLAVIPLDR